MIYRPQFDHADIGLVNDDDTEDFHVLGCQMCRQIAGRETVPAVSGVGAPGGGRSNTHSTSRNEVHQ